MFEVAPSPIHGSGCFATAVIRPGALIGRFEVQPAAGDGPHVLWLDDEPLLVTNELRYLNHAAEPNAEMDELEVRALRRIDPGEEITVHYGPDWTNTSS
ncbi:MAG TPA: SET domain-containing protein [Thermoleophilaceae bacterium]|nr:SET domain-containing protein [Thermoleophilaceae bacterium]